MDLKSNGSTNGELARVALIGSSGFNAQRRVLPELQRFAGRAHIVGYDLRPPAQVFDGIPCVRVRDNRDLRQRLEEQRPTDVLIESTDDAHPDHIELALRCGARRVWCEKCIADTPEAAAALLRVLAEADPGQEVGILDHYALLDPWQTLLANRAAWVGEVESLELTLLEAQGVPPHQEKAHARGMGQVFHHLLGTAAALFDLDDLVPAETEWARHPDAPVPDTYRAARFRSRRTGAEVVRGAVGKYMAAPRRVLAVEGTHGRAWVDRDRGEVRVAAGNGGDERVVYTSGDNGYGAVAQALTTGDPLPGLLDAGQAVQILHLLEQAHGLAREADVYAPGPGGAFVCDWQLAPTAPQT
jgi:predicted dehydrogenase